MTRAALLLAVALAACREQPPGAPETPVPDAAPRAELATPTAPTQAPSPSPPAASAGAGERTFQYSSLENCTALRSEPDEGGFFLERCGGLGGHGLLRSEFDGRQDLALLSPGGRERELDLPAVAGSGFSTLGSTAEWRGRGHRLAFRPDALIVRYSVSADPADTTRLTRHLLVVDLDRACVIARVDPAPDQNAQARAIADSGQAPCLSAPS